MFKVFRFIFGQIFLQQIIFFRNSCWFFYDVNPAKELYSFFKMAKNRENKNKSAKNLKNRIDKVPLKIPEKS